MPKSIGMIASIVVSGFACAAGTSLAQQASEMPSCYAEGHQLLEINDDQVRYWELNTANQFHARAHIYGPIVRLYSDRNGHSHLSVQLGEGTQQTIEVIFNQDFGSLQELAVGAMVEACGDYITSTAAGGGYQASPDGAIIHWIHHSNNAKHESGYIAVNGVLFGN